MFKFYLNRILDLVFPPICLVCRCKLKDSGLHQGILCDICFKKIEPNPAPHCLKCGASIPGRYDLETTCNKCARSYYDFAKAQSPYLYEGVMRECIHLLKYKAKLKMLNVFGKLLYLNNDNKNGFSFIDTIIPVPLHKARLRERGFNQAERLSRLIAQDFPSKIRTDLLKRTKPTIPQANLNASQRLKNVKGVFVVSCSDKVTDKDILLIDDVFTTGATINECAKVLRKAGAKNIFAWTLARTPYENT